MMKSNKLLIALGSVLVLSGSVYADSKQALTDDQVRGSEAISHLFSNKADFDQRKNQNEQTTAEKKLSPEEQEKLDNLVTLVTYAASLKDFAREEFTRVLGALGKRKVYTFDEISQVTAKVWEEVQALLEKHDVYKKIDSGHAYELKTVLGIRFSKHFRSKIIHAPRSKKQAQEAFGLLFDDVVPEGMIKILQRHYPKLDTAKVKGA